MHGTQSWRHQMEIFSALLAICAGNSPVPGEFPTQRPATRSFDVFFDLRLNKRLSKQWCGWWFETPSGPFWHHRNVCSQRCLQMPVRHWVNQRLYPFLNVQKTILFSCLKFIDMVFAGFYIYSISLSMYKVMRLSPWLRVLHFIPQRRNQSSMLRTRAGWK